VAAQEVEPEVGGIPYVAGANTNHDQNDADKYANRPE
jgi:hypothetical protein